jgi:hypothetical protein
MPRSSLFQMPND